MASSEQVRRILTAMGDGGTYDLAHRVSDEVERQVAECQSTAILERLGGMHEVCELIDRPKNVVGNWLRRPGNINFPPFVIELAATKVWDLEQVRTWAKGNPDLVGPGFDPFAEG